jgi:phospholipase/carboxylesterase
VGQPAEEFVHRWEPRVGSDRTLLLLHGTGGDENDLISLGDLLDPAANLLSPRGRVLEHGMPRFFRRLAAGVFDLEDLTARAMRSVWMSRDVRDTARTSTGMSGPMTRAQS